VATWKVKACSRRKPAFRLKNCPVTSNMTQISRFSHGVTTNSYVLPEPDESAAEKGVRGYGSEPVL
jgi:hypothetical protein